MAQTTERSCFEATTFYNKAAHDSLEIATENHIKYNQQNIANSRGEITIPVVVHIVYPTENENISDAQVFSQIDALNRDFNRRNNNLDKVHTDFRGRIANVGFNFCLATIDPEGNATNGITRTATKTDSEFFRGAEWLYYTEKDGKSAWDTEKYLNIWVTKISDISQILGYASKPFESPPEKDGVVIDAKNFGINGTAISPYDLGRTGTHEVAHYFNISHPFNNGCDGDDFVADVPQQSNSYDGACETGEKMSCGNRDNVSNFMNYSQDECLAMFTKGQALRMQAALIHARSGLLNNNACQQPPTPTLTDEIKIYPNPASYYFCIEVGNSNLVQIPYTIFNAQGAKVEEGLVLPNSIQHFPTYRNGIYFVQFMDGSAEGTLKKVVINN
ncbi:MAG: M43 family zinc metalloprotease [Saprospiraceae bacterium]